MESNEIWGFGIIAGMITFSLVVLFAMLISLNRKKHSHH